MIYKVNECFVKANATRSKTSLLQSNQADYLSKVQKGVCPECGQSLLDEKDTVAIQGISSNKKGRSRRYDGDSCSQNMCFKAEELTP